MRLSERMVEWHGYWCNKSHHCKQPGQCCTNDIIISVELRICGLSTETIMILHANQHWVTVAADTTEVRYFDSLRPHQALTYNVTKQIKQLFRNMFDRTEISTCWFIQVPRKPTALIAEYLHRLTRPNYCPGTPRVYKLFSTSRRCDHASPFDPVFRNGKSDPVPETGRTQTGTPSESY